MSSVCFALCGAVLFAQTEVNIKADLAPKTTNPEYNRIVAALESNTDLELVDVSLEKALEQIAEQHKINIVVEDADVVPAYPGFASKANDVSLIISNIRLRSALKLLLEPLHLDFTIDDEVLIISTPEAVDQRRHQTLAYDVSALLNEHSDISSLAEAVHGALPASTRSSAAISGYRNLLLVSGNRHVHESVRKMLTIVKGGIRE